MTVKELKEKLSQFSDDLIVMIPNNDLHRLPNPIWHVPASVVARGCNEEDGCVFIDVEDEDDEED
jgi:hypothetical protein